MLDGMQPQLGLELLTQHTRLPATSTESTTQLLHRRIELDVLVLAMGTSHFEVIVASVKLLLNTIQELKEDSLQVIQSVQKTNQF